VRKTTNVSARSDPAAAPVKHMSPAMRRLRLPRRPALWLFGLSFALNLVWAALNHPFAAPDEPAHLQAVMQVRVRHILPEVHYSFIPKMMGEIVSTPVDQPTLAYAQAQGQTDLYILSPYEGVQPPLFYLVAGALGQLVQPDPAWMLYLSRAVAALFGAGTVAFCWAATRQLAPGNPQWAVIVAGVVLMLPQFCFNSATVGNDSAVNCAAAAAFYVWFRGLRQPDYDRWLLRAGGVVGLALLAKLTGVALLPGLALVLLFRTFQVPTSPGRWRAVVQRGIDQAIGASISLAAVAGWWFLRNWVVYGELTGTRDALRAYTFAGEFRHVLLYIPSDRAAFLQATWQSIWGRFSWMSSPLAQSWYDQAVTISIGLIALSGVAALIALGRALLYRHIGPAYVWQAGLILASAAGVLITGYVQFNQTVDFQAQGRYLFPLLLPAALLFTGGLAALPLGHPWKAGILSLPLLWLALMNAAGLLVIR